MPWNDKAEDALNKIRKLVADGDDWKVAKKTKDVNVLVKSSPEWQGHVYKTEAMMNTDPSTVYKYVEPNPDGPRSTWDKAVKQLEIIEDVDKDTKVVRTITHSAAGGLISPRDFVDLTVKVETDQYISTNGTAIEHPGCPAIQNFVRGTNYPCAIICNRVEGEPQKTLVTCFTQSDVGGMLPRALVESVLPSNQVDFMHNLKKALQDGGHWKEGDGEQ